jgi:hypothetical protein
MHALKSDVTSKQELLMGQREVPTPSSNKNHACPRPLVIAALYNAKNYRASADVTALSTASSTDAGSGANTKRAAEYK